MSATEQGPIKGENSQGLMWKGRNTELRENVALPHDRHLRQHPHRRPPPPLHFSNRPHQIQFQARQAHPSQILQALLQILLLSPLSQNLPEFSPQRHRLPVKNQIIQRQNAVLPRCRSDRRRTEQIRRPGASLRKTRIELPAHGGGAGLHPRDPNESGNRDALRRSKKNLRECEEKKRN